MGIQRAPFMCNPPEVSGNGQDSAQGETACADLIASGTRRPAAGWREDGSDPPGYLVAWLTTAVHDRGTLKNRSQLACCVNIDWQELTMLRGTFGLALNTEKGLPPCIILVGFRADALEN